MTGEYGDSNLKILEYFEGVGGVGQLFSDERLFQIIERFKTSLVFIAAPLTEPPCVRCTRLSCPGVDACEDIEVAYMHYMVNQSPKSKKRKRPVNPQTQRLWDVKRWADPEIEAEEPSYSANKAPITVRAKTLYRRLRELDFPVEVKETQVSGMLQCFSSRLGIRPQRLAEYRAFEVGRERRQEIVERLFRLKIVDLNFLDECATSPENFGALWAAIAAKIHQAGKTRVPTNALFEKAGWVYLPDPSAI